jgi:hypothetical protein
MVSHQWEFQEPSFCRTIEFRPPTWQSCTRSMTLPQSALSCRTVNFLKQEPDRDTLSRDANDLAIAGPSFGMGVRCGCSPGMITKAAGTEPRTITQPASVFKELCTWWKGCQRSVIDHSAVAEGWRAAKRLEEHRA